MKLPMQLCPLTIWRKWSQNAEFWLTPGRKWEIFVFNRVEFSEKYPSLPNFIPAQMLADSRELKINFTVISPFRGKPYFSVFCSAISFRISALSASIPNVKIMTELLSSEFLSLIVLKINVLLSSDGSPSVRNRIILFLVLSGSSKAEAFSRVKAFWKPDRYWDAPVKRERLNTLIR